MAKPIVNLWDAYPYLNNNEIMLLVNYEIHHEDYSSTIVVGLFNFSSKEWLWKNRSLYEKSSWSRLQGKPIIENNIAYQINKGISCLDLGKGEIVWQYNSLNTYSRSGPVLFENLVVAVDDFGNMVALDNKEGTLIWKMPNMGSLPSEFVVVDGILYYISLSNSMLYAVDLIDGKQLWELHSPDLEFDKGAFFRPELSILPGGFFRRDYLIAHTYR